MNERTQNRIVNVATVVSLFLLAAAIVCVITLTGAR